jgi:streptogramin lyase
MIFIRNRNFLVVLAVLFTLHIAATSCFADLIVTGRNASGGAFFRLREDNFATIDQSTPSQGNIAFEGIAVNNTNGKFYISTDFGYHRVMEYNGTTDSLLSNAFTSTDTSSARDAVWGSNGFMYVAGGAGVHRFNAAGAGGAFSTITGGSGTVGLDFGPDNFLYVTSFTGKVSKVDPSTGAVTTFVTDATHLSNTGDLAWGNDGKLYVVAASSIFRYDSSGNYLDTFASNILLNSALGLAFGNDGNLYAATPNNIVRVTPGGVVTTARARSINTDFYSFQFIEFTNIPEPGTFYLSAVAMVGLLIAYKKSKRK